MWYWLSSSYCCFSPLLNKTCMNRYQFFSFSIKLSIVFNQCLQFSSTLLLFCLSSLLFFVWHWFYEPSSLQLKSKSNNDHHDTTMAFDEKSKMKMLHDCPLSHCSVNESWHDSQPHFWGAFNNLFPMKNQTGPDSQNESHFVVLIKYLPSFSHSLFTPCVILYLLTFDF